MRWLGLLTIGLIAFVMAARAQTPTVLHPMPYDKAFGPGYLVARPNFTYPQAVSSLADLDYKNSVLHTFSRQGKHWTCGQLHDGSWEGIEGVSLVKLTFRKSFVLHEDSDPGHVLVLFDYFSGVGKRDNDLYAQVWALQGNHLKIIQQWRLNIHLLELEESYSFDVEQNILKVRATHYLPGDSHACISAYDELIFQWEDSLFRLVKKETKPNRNHC